MALRLPAERVRVETRVTAAGSRKQIERPKPMKSDGMHTTASGAAFQTYYWVHSLIGWILSTFAVVGFSGLVRRD